MGYATVPTVATGDSWSAAQHNTYIRDNFTASWPYTATGDIAYASSSSAITVLPIGSAGDILQASSDVPAWGSIPQFRMCYLKRAANQSVAKNTSTNISFDTEVYDNFAMFDAGSPTIIAAPVDGLYRFTVWVSFSTNDVGTRSVNFFGNFGQIKPSISSQSTVLSFSGIEYINANSTDIHLTVLHSSDTSLNVTASLLFELIG